MEHKRWYSEKCSRCSFPFNKIKAAEVQRCIISTFCYFHKKFSICSKLPLCCRSTISFNFFFIFFITFTRQIWHHDRKHLDIDVKSTCFDGMNFNSIWIKNKKLQICIITNWRHFLTELTTCSTFMVLSLLSSTIPVLKQSSVNCAKFCFVFHRRNKVKYGMAWGWLFNFYVK